MHCKCTCFVTSHRLRLLYSLKVHILVQYVSGYVCGYGTLTCCFPPPLSLLSLTLNVQLWKANWHCTPEVRTCCTLYNHLYYYLTLLVIYKRLKILNNGVALINGHVLTLIVSTKHSQKKTGYPSEPGSSIGCFLNSYLSREFSLATVHLHLHCLLIVVLDWVSV